MQNSEYTPNGEAILSKSQGGSEINWVKQSSAILVVHGIGNQLPIETLDQFARGLIKVYQKEFGDKIELSHHVVDKKDSKGGYWFDNILRISKKGSEHYIDIYEYYWAHYSEDQATWRDINSWVQGVVKGAKKFYYKNRALGQQYKDKSWFFDKKTGQFKYYRYWFFVSFISKLLIGLDALLSGLIWVLGRIPLLGGIAEQIFKSEINTVISGLTNVIGDVVVYNVIDPKSKFYEVKKRIQEGAIKALQHIVEVKKETHGTNYPQVIVAGHSLGSQVAYDAINRLNLLINQNKIDGYSDQGINEITGQHISDHLKGFITFGSPLDKIMFFLRENVEDEQYIRKQILDNFNGFKQRDINFGSERSDRIRANSGLKRHLEKIQWRNYYDDDDYVSGGLDYYSDLTNINCRFKSSFFTHSDYWQSEPFFRDIIIHNLSK